MGKKVLAALRVISKEEQPRANRRQKAGSAQEGEQRDELDGFLLFGGQKILQRCEEEEELLEQNGEVLLLQRGICFGQIH
ncbi:uncharacterized protein MONOS_17993 [Monocercomonoides exilis]|uniref:uncharacterized protein n=1 Tax=Monocercomonoides exilis TaxID=2049356 RepID=UPI003559CB69|nr:hypothetical protein MONOS_17993 [Monocercomonoides exilis]